MLPGGDADYLVLRSRRLFIDNLMDVDKVDGVETDHRAAFVSR